MKRCSWVPQSNKLYCDYHDLEWGKPIFDDRELFELLCPKVISRVYLG